MSPFPQKYKYINQWSVSIFRFLAFSNLISSLWILKLSSWLAELIPDLELLFELYFPSNFKIVVEQISDLKTLKSWEYSDSQKESPYLKSVMNQKRNNSLINDTLSLIQHVPVFGPSTLTYKSIHFILLNRFMHINKSLLKVYLFKTSTKSQKKVKLI